MSGQPIFDEFFATVDKSGILFEPQNHHISVTYVSDGLHIATAMGTQAFKEANTSKAQYRARIIGLCARATDSELDSALTIMSKDTRHDALRPPETGLVMLRGRVGGTGNAFNIGEVTVTRAVVRIENGATGFGYVMGRSHTKALRAALIDALAQDAINRDKIESEFASKVESRLKEIARFRAETVAATKVDFFTLVRGED